MIDTFDYDTSYIPSIPVVEVEIKAERNAPGIRLRAIVDSGADATIVPVQYLEEIQALKGKQAWLRGTAQRRIVVDLYHAWLRIGHLVPMYLEVVGELEGEEVILGRNVLNQFIVTLNGLASVVEISD